jgi:hypothetical protein
MSVYKLSQAGSFKTSRTLYSSMSAGTSYFYGAMVPIATAVGSGSSNGVTFSNIPQTFQDLYLVANGGGSTSGASSLILVTFNGIYPNQLSHTHLLGNGSSVSSGRYTNSDTVRLNGDGALLATTTNPGSYVAHILNYANTNTNKTILCRSAEDQNGSGQTALAVGLLRSTSAITAFNVSQVNGTNTPSSSTFTLYGIRQTNS